MQVIITPIEKSLVIQAKGSEILILPDHVSVLKGLKKSGEFIEYFKYTALLNRSARKLFEAWLRKDSALWKNIYETVGKMDDVEVTKIDDVSRVDRTIRNPASEEKKVEDKPAKPKAKKATVPKEAPEKKEVAKKPAAKKTATKKTAAKKVAKKSSTKKTSKTTTKKASTKVTKTTKKKTAAKKKTTKKKS